MQSLLFFHFKLIVYRDIIELTHFVSMQSCINHQNFSALLMHIILASHLILQLKLKALYYSFIYIITLTKSSKYLIEYGLFLTAIKAISRFKILIFKNYAASPLLFKANFIKGISNYNYFDRN